MEYNFSASFSAEDHRWQINVSGEIDIFNSAEFKESLMDLINTMPANLYIDCTDLEYIDSTALGTLVSMLKHVKEMDYAIILHNLRPNLSKLFKITNLDKVFIIEGDANVQ